MSVNLRRVTVFLSLAVVMGMGFLSSLNVGHFKGALSSVSPSIDVAYLDGTAFFR